ncbi:MAG: hypothetical protein AB7J28_02460 [Hyphomonadaceae bacterium]
MVRLILALVAGVLAGGVTVGVVETIGHMIFPPPPGLNAADPESIRSVMDQISLEAKVAVVVAWGLGVFVGGLVAALIARRGPYPAWWIGAILFGMAAWTMIMIPHPIWMWAAAIAVTLIASYLAGRIGGRTHA